MMVAGWLVFFLFGLGVGGVLAGPSHETLAKIVAHQQVELRRRGRDLEMAREAKRMAQARADEMGALLGRAPYRDERRSA